VQGSSAVVNSLRAKVGVESDSIQMFADIESFFHKLRRKLNRNEWAIRHLKMPVSEGTAEEPGLLLIQIDGFGRGELERAMAKGRMPFLAKLHQQSRYELNTFYSGLPSTTPAVQAELHYGVKAAVPSFSFLDRATGEIGSMFEPERAKALEKQLESQGEPLLKGGSSWSNIYSGGATDAESHFCISNVSLKNLFHEGHAGASFVFWLFQLPSVLRILGLVVVELSIGLWDAIWGLLQRQYVYLEVGMLLSRMCVGVAMREVLTIGGRLDLARGLPIVHLNFLGYDEMSHRRGPDSGFAHWSLPGIDAAIAQLYREAHRSQRRDYQVWIFSDHGQEHSRSFEAEFDLLKNVVTACLPPTVPEAAEDEDRFSIAAMGPVGHIYFKEPLTEAEKQALARELVRKGSLPVVLHLQADQSVKWYDTRGEVVLPAGIEERLEDYPEALRSLIGVDLERLCRHENAGDLVILGYSGQGASWTFAPERGSHAGLAPHEIRGFLLTPPVTRIPSGGQGFVRPGELRAAALHALGRESLPKFEARTRHHTELRVMTYNTHSCLGTDGRISPRRIARIISQEQPDIVALQELDHGRRRSRGEDQATIIADLLGYHVVFCPTVVVGEERYGHAILSRFPIETIKVAELPTHARSIWPERRSALWSRISLHDVQVNVVTTHLGLSSRERQAQIKALLGEDWLGSVLESEPVILCGDLNCRPGGPTYRMAMERLSDTVSVPNLHTFSTMKPLVRLDHIFTTKHFACERISVVRNHLTRVSSDHLPLVADLVLEA